MWVRNIEQRHEWHGRCSRKRMGLSTRDVVIPLENAITLEGALRVPDAARGIVVFVHGSGSSRLSSRNRHVANVLEGQALATLLFDLLTRDEEDEERETAHLRFDIELLAERLDEVTRWLGRVDALRELRVGYFGASTGAAAALVSAARDPGRVAAVVSRGGRPDLAGAELRHVRAPTLLIVGSADEHVLALNRDALDQLGC